MTIAEVLTHRLTHSPTHSLAHSLTGSIKSGSVFDNVAHDVDLIKQIHKSLGLSLRLYQHALDLACFDYFTAKSSDMSSEMDSVRGRKNMSVSG